MGSHVGEGVVAGADVAGNGPPARPTVSSLCSTSAAPPIAAASDPFTDGTTRTYEWDLTNYVKAEKAAGRNVVSFVIKATSISAPYVTFASDGTMYVSTGDGLRLRITAPDPANGSQ